MGRIHRQSEIVLFLALFCIAVTHSALTTHKLNIVDCSDGTWQMVLISTKQRGDTVDIVADLSNSQNFTGYVHKISFKLTGCHHRGRCENISDVQVDDIDCDCEDLTEQDENACAIAESLSSCDGLSGEISSWYISGIYGKICFIERDVDVQWDSSSSSESDSGSTSHGSSGGDSSSTSHGSPEDSGSTEHPGSPEHTGSTEEPNSSTDKNPDTSTHGSHEKTSPPPHHSGSSESPDHSGSSTQSTGSSTEKTSHEH